MQRRGRVLGVVTEDEDVAQRVCDLRRNRPVEYATLLNLVRQITSESLPILNSVRKTVRRA